MAQLSGLARAWVPAFAAPPWTLATTCPPLQAVPAAAAAQLPWQHHYGHQQSHAPPCRQSLLQRLRSYRGGDSDSILPTVLLRKYISYAREFCTPVGGGLDFWGGGFGMA